MGHLTSICDFRALLLALTEEEKFKSVWRVHDWIFALLRGCLCVEYEHAPYIYAVYSPTVPLTRLKD